ncbi:TRAP transporter small permease [Paenibacillus sp.]|uniref:TRAP transporter small permease n=1 Tax=Paenibacillus sp. TaxID=58172 RepID=UPI002D5148C7|nr:TRAP transporter small permease [Paenibacillus sp.]HZG55294.1 TRAP transporter small permease [Paenibacillus sp.]
MRTAVKLVDGLNKLVGAAVAVMLGTMAILIIVQVFCRFVINYPLHWTEELARYLMVYVVFLGSALALRHSKLVAIEAVAEALKPKARKWLKIVVMLVSIVFFVVLLKQGIDIQSVVSRQTAAGLGIPMSIPYAAIPIGAALLLLNAIAVIMESLTTPATEQNTQLEERL